MPYKLFIVIAFALIIHPLSGFSQDSLRIPVTDFNPDMLNETENTNPKWDELKLPKRELTDYERITMNDEEVIRAESMNSASGLVYQVDIDPNEYPVLEWRWMVNEVLEKGDLRSKKGDDYPARIYITFDYNKKNLKLGDRLKHEFIRTFTSYDIPLRAINYIWANKAEPGTIAPNAYSDWVYMVAVQSGNDQAGTWVINTQNIVNDYKEAFGEAPPRITGIAIMTDSDDTRGKATAYYGDIIFRKN